MRTETLSQILTSDQKSRALIAKLNYLTHQNANPDTKTQKNEISQINLYPSANLLNKAHQLPADIDLIIDNFKNYTLRLKRIDNPTLNLFQKKVLKYLPNFNLYLYQCKLNNLECAEQRVYHLHNCSPEPNETIRVSTNGSELFIYETRTDTVSIHTKYKIANTSNKNNLSIYGKHSEIEVFGNYSSIYFDSVVNYLTLYKLNADIFSYNEKRAPRPQPFFTINIPLSDINVQVSKCSIYSSRIQICHLNLSKVNEVAMRKISSDQLNFTSPIPSRIPSIELRDLEPTENEYCEMKFSNGGYKIDLHNCKPVSLNFGAATELRLAIIKHCNLTEPFRLTKHIFRKAKILDIEGTNIGINFSKYSRRDYWPQARTLSQDNCLTWEITCAELAQQARLSSSSTGVEFFTWLGQSFRRRCERDRQAKFLLFFYSLFSDFGNNFICPLFHLLMYFIGALLFYMFLYRYFPALCETSALEAGTIATCVLSPALKGLFPLHQFVEFSLLINFFVALHSLLSTLLYFLIGFAVRNHLRFNSL